MKKLFPNAKVTIGPAIENKFFYDFDVKTPFTEKDLEMIEKKMFELASLNQVVKREELSRDEAIENKAPNKDYDKAANLIKRYGGVAFNYVLKNDDKTFFKNFKFKCVLE